ncbi:AEC family transporter [Dehalobacterium formicoaceticum]|uniref:AEC family transporter n=1 Tax=Dehalobacterium formicoaceticum TaxID=51515 RepID=A0ABT1Y3P9_9FIRM|nr:AEC family transporter [Dehalobacterium formicoaceticum]MCR6545497.1 AEC family transporter [Dehalobacterium formicoaceticum]
MLVVLNQIVILFILIIIGYFCKKIKLISNDMNHDISNLLVNVAVPALIIVSLNSMTFSQDLMVKSLQLLFMSFCQYLFIILISYPLVKMIKVEGKTRDVFQFSLIFGNTTFMGYPVALAALGQQGLFYMAVYDIMFSVFAWTYGVVIMSRPLLKAQDNTSGDFDFTPQPRSIKKIISPPIAAVVIGFIILASPLTLPVIFEQTLEMIGGITTPLAMIFIGSVLGEMELRTLFQDGKAILWSLLRLIFLPLMVYGVLRILNFDGYQLGIPVLYASMPVAAMTSIFAAKYDNDYRMSSKLIFISTFLSIFTLPLVMWVLLR